MSNLPALKIKPQDAIERIREKFPDEAAALEAVVKNNVVALGTDEAFALRDNEGVIRAFKMICQLSIANGGLVRLPIGGGTDIVSAQGYEIWAEKAAASVIFPTEVLVYGKAMENPAPLFDPDKNWTGWAVRAAAFRFSGMGLPQVSDRTVIFDINNRKNIEFLGKAKKFPQAFRVLAKGAKPPADDGSWIEYEFDKSSSLWVNASHNEALDWYSDISQLVKNSLQLAQTHAARNALKHLSGLQKAPDKTGVWNIPVIAWRPDGGGIVKWDPTTYKNLQAKVSNLISGDRSEFKQIEITSGVDHLEEEDYEAVTAGEVDETSTRAPEEQSAGTAEASRPAKKDSGKKKQLSEADQQVINNLKVAIDAFPEDFKAACVGLQIKQLSAHEYDPKTAAAIMREINHIIDTRNQ